VCMYITVSTCMKCILVLRVGMCVPVRVHTYSSFSTHTHTNTHTHTFMSHTRNTPEHTHINLYTCTNLGTNILT